MKGEPGASGRVLPPVTGRSWVRVTASSHCTGEGKACHWHPSLDPTQSGSSLHWVRPFSLLQNNKYFKLSMLRSTRSRYNQAKYIHRWSNRFQKKRCAYLVQVIYLRNPTDNCNHKKKPCVWISSLIHSIRCKLYGNTNGFDANDLQSQESSVTAYSYS